MFFISRRYFAFLCSSFSIVVIIYLFLKHCTSSIIFLLYHGLIFYYFLITHSTTNRLIRVHKTWEIEVIAIIISLTYTLFIKYGIPDHCNLDFLAYTSFFCKKNQILDTVHYNCFDNTSCIIYFSTNWNWNDGDF